MASCVRSWCKKGKWLLAFVLLFVGLWTAGAAAQDPARVDQLTISLWPEYDDPRLLVILSGTLSQANVRLRVPLPEGAELHAAAYVDEQGNLLNTSWQADEGAVVVVVPTRQFHVEYYVDAIRVDQETQETVVQARVPVPEAMVIAAVLVVQEPANTANFRGDPPLGLPEPGADGLRYASRDLGALPPGAVVRQEVRYVRLKPGLSVTSVLPTPAAPPVEPVDRSVRVRPEILLAVATALLLATGTFVFVRIRRGSPGQRPPQVPHHLGGKVPKARYCPACGHPFGPQDRYCAMCGTPRPGVTQTR